MNPISDINEVLTFGRNKGRTYKDVYCGDGNFTKEDMKSYIENEYLTLILPKYPNKYIPTKNEVANFMAKLKTYDYSFEEYPLNPNYKIWKGIINDCNIQFEITDDLQLLIKGDEKYNFKLLPIIMQEFEKLLNGFYFSNSISDFIGFYGSLSHLERKIGQPTYISRYLAYEQNYPFTNEFWEQLIKFKSYHIKVEKQVTNPTTIEFKFFPYYYESDDFMRYAFKVLNYV